MRILDAAFNRAAEGLRVVEDYLRFGLDDAHLTRLAKQLRHELATHAAALGSTEQARARDSGADVGRTISNHSERSRRTAEDVVAASFKRVEQALRSLEEYGKLRSNSVAALLEQLRYRTYTLEKAALVTQQSSDRLAQSRLYVLLDGRADSAEFEATVQALVAGGVDLIQLRDKRLDDRDLLARAHLLRRLTSGGPTLAVINDRPDIAALSRADGVHVGQEELDVQDVRAIVGAKILVGVSTHSIEQARQAVLDGADYLGVGPTFPSTTKKFEAFAGLDFVRAVAAEIRLPAFAIGGIGPRNVAQVVAAGLRRVAVSSAIVEAANVEAAARGLRTALEPDAERSQASPA